MIELTADDGHKFSAYRVDPAETPKGAVVVLQETYGINSHIRKLADSFAAQGYVAIAPSLFDRVKPNVELGYDEPGMTEGLNVASQIATQEALRDIQAAVDAVKEIGKVAVVGYSWGGYLAYASAKDVKGLACAVAYYGNGIEDDLDGRRKIPTLVHFGESDVVIPFDKATQFRRRRPDVSAFSYPAAGHGFNCDERNSFNADAAHAALDRTLFWISQFVVGQEPVQLKNAGAYAMAKTDKKKKKEATADLGPPMD